MYFSLIKAIIASKHFLVLSLLFIIFNIVPALAQSATDIVFKTVDTAVNADNEQLTDIAFELENKSTQRFKGGLHFYVPKQLKIVNKDHLPIYLLPGEKKFIVLKLYIKSNAAAGTLGCYAQLYNDSRTLVIDKTTSVLVNPRRKVKAALIEPQIIMPQRGDDIKIPVRVANDGNTKQNITVITAFPADVKDETNASISVSVAPFSDTVIFFSRRVTLALQRLEDLPIAISGIYENGDFFFSQTLLVQAAKSRRRYNTGSTYKFQSGLVNSLSLGVQNLGTMGEAYFVRSNGEYLIGKANFSYNLNVLKWKADGLPTQINNTWINYERNGFGIHLGNITNIGEVNLNGRGIEVYYRDTSSKTTTSFGFVDKSFNLIATDGNNYSLGKAAWASLKKSGQKLSASSMLIYDTEQYLKTKSLIWMNEGTWQIKDGLQARARFGLAGTQAQLSTNEGTIGSYLLGASLTGFVTKNISIASDNLYSSGYFPGMRRGMTTVNQLIAYHFGKSQVFASYNNYSYRPKFLNISNDNFLGAQTHVQVAELGIAQFLGAAFSYSISPVVYKEFGRWRGVANINGVSLSAARLNTVLSFTSVALKQSLSLRLEGGQYKTTLMPTADWQYKASVNWNYATFRMTATAQKGLFLLAESFREDVTPTEFYRYSVMPMLSSSFFGSKLRLEAGLNFFKDNFMTNMAYMGSFQFDLNKTRLFGNFQYSTFNNIASYNNIMLGLTRTLPSSRPNQKSNNNELSVLVFKDINNDGIFDNGDEVSAAERIYINGTMFITNGNGKITYQKLPAGIYKIKPAAQNGWYGEDKEIMLSDKNKKTVELGLSQTGAISGVLSFEEPEQEELNYAVLKDKAVQTVVALNESGKSTITKTDNNGNYTFYLPAGKYELSVIDLPAQIEATNNNRTVIIVAGNKVEHINFSLRVKQRKIEVKKFGKK